jgi:hypothetical protein
MDIRRAKIILIGLFMIINLVLLSVIVFSGNNTKVSNEIIQNIHMLFEKNNKVIECRIPDDLKPMHQLEMGQTITAGRNAVEGFDEEDHRFFYDFGDFKIYAQKYKGWWILENRILVYEDGLEYTSREIIGFDQAKKSIIPAYAILLKEYLNSSYIKIQRIEMVYLKYLNEDIFGPVWFIVADDIPRYFYALEAFDGLEMRWEVVS